jgi:hypothetical protein
MDAFIEAIWDFAPQEVLDALVNFRDNILPGLMEQVTAVTAPIAAWIQNNIQLSDVLIALGIAIASVVIPALLSIAATMLPIIAVGAALVAGVALIRTAWENNWGGIQEKVQVVLTWLTTVFYPWFNDVLMPFLTATFTAALQGLATFWETVLLPAITAVWEWMSNTLMPFFVDTVVPWLEEKIPAALQTLTDFWNDTLLPVMKGVWDFLTVRMMPIWEEIGELLGVAIPLVLTALQGIWENVLLPAMTAVWEFIKDKLGPIFQWLKDSLIDPASAAFGTLSDAIAKVAGWISTLKEALAGITLPPWMTPGSPTPWENGLVGVGQAIQTLLRTELP